MHRLRNWESSSKACLPALNPTACHDLAFGSAHHAQPVRSEAPYQGQKPSRPTIRENRIIVAELTACVCLNGRETICTIPWSLAVMLWWQAHLSERIKELHIFCKIMAKPTTHLFICSSGHIIEMGVTQTLVPDVVATRKIFFFF